MTQRDMAAWVKPIHVSRGVLTAGAASSGALVTGASINIAPAGGLNYGSPGEYYSGLVVIDYLATLTSNSSLTFYVQYQDAAVDLATAYSTNVTLMKYVVPSVPADTTGLITAATIATTATTKVEGVVSIPINLRGKNQFVRLNIIPSLTNSGTDTAEWHADVIVNGAYKPIS